MTKGFAVIELIGWIAVTVGVWSYGVYYGYKLKDREIDVQENYSAVRIEGEGVEKTQITEGICLKGYDKSGHIIVGTCLFDSNGICVDGCK